MNKTFSVAEVAKQLDLSPDSVYRMCRVGKIGHYRMGASGGKIRIAEKHLAAYLAKAEIEVQDDPQESHHLNGPLKTYRFAVPMNERGRK